jgi:hypothetical protein
MISRGPCGWTKTGRTPGGLSLADPVHQMKALAEAQGWPAPQVDAILCRHPQSAAGAPGPDLVGSAIAD